MSQIILIILNYFGYIKLFFIIYYICIQIDLYFKYENKIYELLIKHKNEFVV